MSSIKIIDKYAGRYCRVAGDEIYGVYLQQDENNADNAVILKTDGVQELVDYEYLHFLSDEELRLNSRICRVGDVGYVSRGGCVDVTSVFIVTRICDDKVTIAVADPVTGQETPIRMADFTIHSRPTPVKHYERTREDD